ncbi:MAG: alpha/beta fold hydrolase [Rhizobiaceae bacterium]
MDRLHAVVRGEGPETIVLIHGFGGCGAMWEPVAGRLADRTRLISYDLPGHGGSLAFPGAGSAKAAATVILADLAARGIETAHFSGHSMGGAVATLAAITDPGRVASLTLLAPGGFGPEINGRLLARYAVARESAEIVRCLEGMFGFASPIPDETVRILAAMRAAPGQCEALSDIATRIAKDGRQGVIPRELVAALTMPVAVAWGDLDGVLPPRHADGLPARFAVHAIAGAGHMLVEEAGERVAALVAETAGIAGS